MLVNKQNYAQGTKPIFLLKLESYYDMNNSYIYTLSIK